MLFGLPVFDVSRVFVVLAKVSVFGLFIAFFTDFANEFSGMVSHVLANLLGSIDVLNGLNLGYFAGAIGLVDFLNNFVSSLIIALNFFVSGMLTIIIFKGLFFAYSRVFNF